MAKPFVKKVEIKDDSIRGLITIDKDAEWGEWFKDKNGKVLLTNVDVKNLCHTSNVSVLSEVVLEVELENGGVTLVSPVIFKPVDYLQPSSTPSYKSYYFGRDACSGEDGVYPCGGCYNKQVDSDHPNQRCNSLFSGCTVNCYVGVWNGYSGCTSSIDSYMGYRCISGCHGPAVGYDININTNPVLEDVSKSKYGFSRGNGGQWSKYFSDWTRISVRPEGAESFYVIPKNSTCDEMCQTGLVGAGNRGGLPTTKDTIAWTCQAEAGNMPVYQNITGMSKPQFGLPPCVQSVFYDTESNYDHTFTYQGYESSSVRKSVFFNVCDKDYNYTMDCNGYYTFPGATIINAYGDALMAETPFWNDIHGRYFTSSHCDSDTTIYQIPEWDDGIGEIQPSVLGPGWESRDYVSNGQNGLNSYSYFRSTEGCQQEVQGMECAHNTAFYHCPTQVSCINQNAGCGDCTASCTSGCTGCVNCQNVCVSVVNGCRVGCVASCYNSCDGSCVYAYDTCSNSCQTCVANCFDFCDDSCYYGCLTGCVASCYNNCYMDCTNNCLTFCDACADSCVGQCTSCVGSCNNGCNSCDAGCVNGCYLSCVGVCYSSNYGCASCYNGCNWCVSGCDAGCYGSCHIGCYANCVVYVNGCYYDCHSSCASSCDACFKCNDCTSYTGSGIYRLYCDPSQYN